MLAAIWPMVATAPLVEDEQWEPMTRLSRAYQRASCGGSCSLEERMGCGFGACMGCSVQTKNGIKRVCKEGPVFSKEELIW